MVLKDFTIVSFCDMVSEHNNIVSLVSRQEIRELGMTILLDARKTPPPPQLHQAVMMLQVGTSLLFSSVVFTKWCASAEQHLGHMGAVKSYARPLSTEQQLGFVFMVEDSTLHRDRLQVYQ